MVFNRLLLLEILLQINEWEELSLITGKELKDYTERLKTLHPTSEASYLSASEKRLEEARKKAQEMELLGSEETEVRLEESTMTNYGPGNLPAFRGFSDDGFEASECKWWRDGPGHE